MQHLEGALQNSRSRDAIRATLAGTGFVVLPAISAVEFRQFVEGLGQIEDETVVQLRPDVRTYLCQPEGVPHHTDHPVATWIAWRCEEQDATDGAQSLCDAWLALRRCSDETVRVLSMIRLGTRRRGDSTVDVAPMLQFRDGRPRIVFAPWLRPVGDDAEQHRAFAEFAAAVAATSREQEVRVRLAPDEALIVDNARMLHGRTALAAGSRRRLRRFWIARSK